MFRIREDQIETFERQALERFCRRAAAHLAERSGATAEAPDHAKILPALVEARAHGIVTDRDMIRYLELLVDAGGLEAADRIPWIREILSDGWTPPAFKMDALERRAAREAGSGEAAR